MNTNDTSRVEFKIDLLLLFTVFFTIHQIVGFLINGSIWNTESKLD